MQKTKDYIETIEGCKRIRKSGKTPFIPNAIQVTTDKIISCNFFYNLMGSISMIGSIGVFTFVTWSPEWIEIVDYRNNSFSTNNVDDGFILSHIILHLFLNVRIVFENVLKVLLAKDEVLF